ncbi:MAG TPA: PAS domain S-box protein [Vicinamibacteria bacterium]|nr:PAS domain S-box protein [Vicinamibacteria bacterium]
MSRGPHDAMHGDARHRAPLCLSDDFLSLSGDGVARFELVPPLVVGAAEEEQVDHILRQGRITECNELLAGLYGRTRREMIGLAMEDFVPRDEPARHQGIREFIRAGYRLPYSEEEQTFRAGSKAFAVAPIFSHGRWWGLLGFGETRYERTWSAPEAEALKAAAAVLGAAIEREGADVALRESEERFERLAAAACEAIAITEAGVFVDGNDQLASMLALPRSELAGRPVQDFVAPEDRERVIAHIASGLEGPYQHVALRADGSRFPVEVRARLETLSGREPWRTVLDLHQRVGERGASVVAEAREPTTGRDFYVLGSPGPGERASRPGGS